MGGGLLLSEEGLKKNVVITELWYLFPFDVAAATVTEVMAGSAFV